MVGVNRTVGGKKGVICGERVNLKHTRFEMTIKTPKWKY